MAEPTRKASALGTAEGVPATTEPNNRVAFIIKCTHTVKRAVVGACFGKLGTDVGLRGRVRRTVGRHAHIIIAAGRTDRGKFLICASHIGT